MNVSSQNLIPNGDFENYSSCPNAGSQLPLSYPWTAAPNNSVEYFNACSSVFGVPYQNANFQQAHSGQGIIGCWFMNGNGSYREYPQIQLTSQLVGGNYYYACFYVNRMPGPCYAINNIGGSFQSAMTTTTSSASSNNVLNYPINIQKFGNPIICDTLNWVKIETVYQAGGTENFFLIGNFENDNNTDTLNMNDGVYYGAYYFIDDVSLTNITTPQWQYRDTTINCGDSVLIGPAITGLNVDWYTMANAFIKNDPGIYVKPTVTTSYKATETFNSATYNHTVTVTVLTTGIKEQQKLNATSIYPNPNNGTFTIANSNRFDNIQAVIYDTNGKIAYQTKLNGSQQNINVDFLKDGIYFLQLLNEKQSISVYKKLIIQK